MYKVINKLDKQKNPSKTPRMATENTKDKHTPGLKECCDSCKVKLESFWEEWTNNFKMCYCPWRSKTYDIDADNNTTAPLLTKEQESTDEETIQQATAANSDTTQPLTTEESKDAKPDTQDHEEKAEDKESSEVHVVQVGEVVRYIIILCSYHTLSTDTYSVLINCQQVPMLIHIVIIPTSPQRVPTIEELQSLNIEPFVWNQLGFFLQVDGDSLSAIGRNAPTTQDALKQVYQIWLETAESPSWEDLAQALEVMDLKNLAAEVRQKYN